MAMVQLVETQAPQWQEWVADYDAARAKFLAVWNKLKTQRDWIVKNQPSLLKTHDAVMQKMRDQTANIDNLGKLRNDVAGWLGQIGRFVGGAVGALASIPGAFAEGGRVIANTTGLTGALQSVAKFFGFGGDDNNLGVAPIVWVGISLGGALAAVAIISDAVQKSAIYSASMDAFQAALAKGATPEQAAQSVRDVVNSAAAAKASTQQEFMGIPLTTLAIAGVIIVLGPPLIAAFRERK